LIPDLEYKGFTGLLILQVAGLKLPVPAHNRVTFWLAASRYPASYGRVFGR
jgi:hypothetical protein